MFIHFLIHSSLFHWPLKRCIRRELYVCLYWMRRRTGVRPLLSNRFWSEFRTFWMSPISKTRLRPKHILSIVRTKLNTKSESKLRRRQWRHRTDSISLFINSILSPLNPHFVCTLNLMTIVLIDCIPLIVNYIDFYIQKYFN